MEDASEGAVYLEHQFDEELQGVRRFTDNPFEIYCHKVHNQMIKAVDQVIYEPVPLYTRQANQTQTDTIGRLIKVHQAMMHEPQNSFPG